MNIHTRKPWVDYLKLTPSDVALLQILESRGFLPEWDGDATVVSVAPPICEDEGTDGDLDSGSEQSELEGEESDSRDEDFYSADEDCEGE